MANPYDTGLDKTPANYQPLTPLVFLERAAQVHPGHTAIIHGSDHSSYSAFSSRTRKLSSALAAECVADPARAGGRTQWVCSPPVSRASAAGAGDARRP